MTGVRPVPVALIENSIGLSGSTLSLGTLVKRLDRSRFAPHVVVARPEQEAYLRARLDPAIPIARIAPRRGLKASRWARRGRRVLPRLAALLDLAFVSLPYAAALRRFMRRHGIRLVHHNNGFDVAALLLCRVMGLPVVAYQRGNEWHSWLVRRLAPLASRYVANSEATRDDLLALGIARERISVVYPPVDLADFGDAAGAAPGRALSRAAYGVPADAPCFGIVGQLQEWKGQKVFLRAARRVLDARPEARAWVIGDTPAGEEAYGAELRELARTLGITDRVVFTGFVADVPGALRLLDVFVHASVYPEPFGRVIVEAMLVGRPVVAADAGGPREIIEPGRTGLLVPPGDDAGVSAAILRLLADREFAANVAEAGRLEARRRFSAEEHARIVQSIYDSVLAAGTLASTGAAPEPTPSGAAREGGC
jgi:glycosyltransferase involved in cell wall biosynthesis